MAPGSHSGLWPPSQGSHNAEPHAPSRPLREVPSQTVQLLGPQVSLGLWQHQPQPCPLRIEALEPAALAGRGLPPHPASGGGPGSSKQEIIPL